MAKCPWCGKDMLAYVFSRGWAARCPNVDCPEKVYHATPDKALAAASKRFMPKRTVEEIKQFIQKAEFMWADEFLKAPKNMHEGYFAFLTIVMETRIADYIHGAE